MGISNEGGVQMSPFHSNWTHPCRYYFVFHHPHPGLWSLDICSRVYRAISYMVAYSDVTLTCMSGFSLAVLHVRCAISLALPRQPFLILHLSASVLPSCLSLLPTSLEPHAPFPTDSQSPSLVSLLCFLHFSHALFLRLLLLRNAAPQCIDVIIMQHLLLCRNTDEQQNRDNKGTVNNSTWREAITSGMKSISFVH